LSLTERKLILKTIFELLNWSVETEKEKMKQRMKFGGYQEDEMDGICSKN
jgi:hypothetical protein